MRQNKPDRDQPPWTANTATAANTAAKPLDNDLTVQTILEYRPSAQTATDGPGRRAHSYGAEGRARSMPDEAVHQGS